MAGFLGTKEVLNRDRVKEILRNKEYSHIEQNVTLLDIRDDSMLLKVSFLLEYRKNMIYVEESDPRTHSCLHMDNAHKTRSYL